MRVSAKGGCGSHFPNGRDGRCCVCLRISRPAVFRPRARVGFLVTRNAQSTLQQEPLTALALDLNHQTNYCGQVW